MEISDILGILIFLAVFVVSIIMIDPVKITCTNGDIFWHKFANFNDYKDVILVEYSDGIKERYLNGKMYTDGDLPSSELPNGDKVWYRNGKVHRHGDLPAFECANGYRAWYVHGKRHRIGILPAIELANGNRSYYKYDRQYSLQELTDIYLVLARFGRLCLGRIRLHRMKSKKWIHGELLCSPPRGNFSGGQDYHKIVDYFNAL